MQRFFVGNILQTLTFVEVATANETLFPLYVVDGVATSIRCAFLPEMFTSTCHACMQQPGCLPAVAACQSLLSLHGGNATGAHVHCSDRVDRKGGAGAQKLSGKVASRCDRTMTPQPDCYHFQCRTWQRGPGDVACGRRAAVRGI